MGGYSAILTALQDYVKTLKKYYNFWGKAYMVWIIVARVLLCEQILNGLGDDDGLVCDTQQVGCNSMCVNRFSPVLSHDKLWELQLLFTCFCVTIFTLFVVVHTELEKRQQKSENSYMKIKEKQRLRTNGQTEPYTKSVFTDIGYLLMLIFRFGFELWFLYVENQLGKHQSQKADFWDSFNLKEYWMCPTQPDAAAVSATIPVEQRSELFWVDEVNEACQQQTVEVRCWIPFSWMKTYALWIMYFVLIVQTILTGLELAFHLGSLCCGKSSKIEDPVVLEISSKDNELEKVKFVENSNEA